METIRNAIQAGNEKFMSAFKQGDAAAVAALYTSDAKLLPPNNQMLSGPPEIQAFWQGAMNLGIKDAKLETVAVETRDDLAVEVGRYTLTIQPEGGDSLTDTGKYVVAWKNDNGGELPGGFNRSSG
jgi:uncharacterized protein (TIGR02246 family)